MKKATLTLLMLVAFSYLSCANIKDMAKIIDLSGNTFGDFKVVSYHSQNKYNDAIWLCQCIKCGKQKPLIGSSIKNGRRINCNCVHFNYKHGDCNKTKEYRAYRHMLNRCYNQNVVDYPRYGGRGIIVCERWRNSYKNFLSDMGRSPSSKHSLDRIKVNGHYTPKNCRWATAIEQANNKRTTYLVNYGGRIVPLGLLAKEVNMPIELMRGRLNLGWSIDRTISTPNMRAVKSDSPIEVTTETKAP